MFRVLDIATDRTCDQADGVERVSPPEREGVFRWIDLEAQDEEQLAVLRERFGFHSLAIEDCAHFDQRPKVEEYGGYLFVVTHGFRCAPSNGNGDGEDKSIGTDLIVEEVHAFVGKNYLVTVHQERVLSVESLRQRIMGDPSIGCRGGDFVYYLLLDSLVDSAFPILDEVATGVEQLEDTVLDKPSKDLLATLFSLKQTLGRLRRITSPTRDVIAHLSRHSGPFISEKTSVYLRDVYDHVVRIHESIEVGRDRLGNVLDAYLSALSNRSNDIMLRLTVLSAIFLPITFITGFFGQNFEHLPFSSHHLLWIVSGACVLIPSGMLFWFRRSKWF